MGVILEVLDLLVLLFQLLRSIEGDIGLAGIKELLDIFLIDVTALALAVGTMVTANADTLIELDAEPFE